ncbi:MAG: hypothetical protein JJ895_08750 [Balneolaceae bacterium]|nr:hypothetical protein [Balneolaceae bacterium]
MQSRSKKIIQTSFGYLLGIVGGFVFPAIQLFLVINYMEQNIDPGMVLDRFEFLKNDLWFALTIYPISACFVILVFWVNTKITFKAADILDSIFNDSKKTSN